MSYLPRSSVISLSTLMVVALVACGSPQPPEAPSAAPTPPRAATAPLPSADTAAPSIADTAAPSITDTAPPSITDTAAPSSADTAPTPSADTAALPSADIAPTPSADATSPAATRPALTPLPSGPGTLNDRLTAAFGADKPIAILPWLEGLIAVSADGARAHLLVPGPMTWALVDERARVIWFGRAGERAKPDDLDVTTEIWALDLLAEGLEPRRIARGFGGGLEIAITYPPVGDSKRPDRVGFGRGHGPSVTIVVDAKRPRLEGEGGVYVDMEIADGRDHMKAIKRAQPDAATRAFLKTLAERGEGRTLEPPRPEHAALPERVPVPTDACQDDEACGVPQAFTGTPYWLVTVEHSCGDACFVAQNLYDPRTRVWLDPNQPGTTSDKPLGEAANVGQAFVARDGSAFVMEATLFAMGRPPLAPLIPEDSPFIPRAGGWLGGGWYVD